MILYTLRERKMDWLRLALALVVGCWLLAPAPAAAQCETALSTILPLNNLVNKDVNNINLWLGQEANPKMQGANGSPGGFLDNIIESAFGMNTSGGHGLFQYYTGFYASVQQALSGLATQLDLSLKDMTAELDTARVDQSYQFGQLIDAQLWSQEKTNKENLMTEAHRRYQPSEMACGIDTTGPGLSRIYQISRALNRGFAEDNDDVLGNAVGSISEHGHNQDLSAMWQQYVAMFCDPTMGDQGCTAAGPLAGKEKDIGHLLWGPQQTIDPTDKKNIVMMEAALRYVVDPLTSDPLSVNVAKSAGGHVQILLRHSQMAYVNDIYNVLGSMLSKRVGGSGIDVSKMEQEAGVPAADTTPEGTAGASYSEIMGAMTRYRFESPYYLVRMLGSKSQVMREQGALDALRLQTMNDTFHTLENRLFLESAAYARDLDEQLPKAAPQEIPMN